MALQLLSNESHSVISYLTDALSIFSGFNGLNMEIDSPEGKVFSKALLQLIPKQWEQSLPI
jgi:hypothetical protein